MTFSLVFLSLALCLFFPCCLCHGLTEEDQDLLAEPSHHDKKWKTIEGHWKKGGVDKVGYGFGNKYRDDHWDDWGKHGKSFKDDKVEKKFDKFGKHHGGKEEHGKHIGGGQDQKSWGGEGVHGGKGKSKHFHDKGHKSHGFKNTYQKTEDGNHKTYHDVSNDEKDHQGYNNGDHWTKHTGSKYHKGHGGKSHFGQGVHGGTHRDSGSDKHNDQNGGVWEKGAKNYGRSSGHKNGNTNRFNAYQQHGNHGYKGSSGGGGGGFVPHHHHH